MRLILYFVPSLPFYPKLVLLKSSPDQKICPFYYILTICPLHLNRFDHVDAFKVQIYILHFLIRNNGV
jgi:hypothetical protein